MNYRVWLHRGPRIAGHLIGAAALLTAAAMPLTAQQPSAPTLQVTARLVVLDVVVTDAKGQLVNGLTRDDFRVYENNTLQAIRSFEPPSAHHLPEQSLADTEDESTLDPANPAAFAESPVTILVLDQLNTHFADSSFARRSLSDYLTQQPSLLTQPAALMAVQDSGLHLLQGFTRDRGALERALKNAPVAYDWRLEQSGQADQGPIERLDISLRGLEQIIASYARVPGRKNVIWVGGGFPTIDPGTLDQGEVDTITATLRHLTDLMLASRVTLYAIDPTTLVPGMTEITDQDQAAFAMAAADSLSTNVGTVDANQDFDKLSVVTGGRVVRGRNDIAQQIGSAVHLGTQYYTLSYTPPSSSATPPDVRKIKVVCVRPGLTATTRTEYYPAETASAEAAQNAAYDLNTAAESPVPLHGLHLSAQRTGASPQGDEIYTVSTPVPDLSWHTNPDGASIAKVIVLAAQLDARGKIISRTLRGLDARVGPAVDLHDPAHSVQLQVSIPHLEKQHSLRFIVRDATSGRMGSIEIPGAVQQAAP